MRKIWKIIIVIVSFGLLLVVFAGVFIFIQYKKYDQKPVNVLVEINDKGKKIASFEVELAVSLMAQAKGLMDRDELAYNHGMFFIFNDEMMQSFWMKNTYIPLDIIFVNADNQIINIAKDAQPCQKSPCKTYLSDRPAKYVLEINGGLSNELGIKPGQEIVLKNQQ